MNDREAKARAVKILAKSIYRDLEAQGFDVEAALDGIEGERLALSGSFDAIVLDMMLPGRSGFLVLEKIKARKPKNANRFWRKGSITARATHWRSCNRLSG